MTEFCRGQIATFKIPPLLEVRRCVPDDGHGKMQKFIMRQTAIKELGLEAAASVQTA